MAKHLNNDPPSSDAWRPRTPAAASSAAEVAGPAGGGPPRPGRSEALPADRIELRGYHDFTVVARSQGSVVYRARQVGLDRHVAVKVLLLSDAEAAARFQREIDITVRLGRQHPHIVTVIDSGVTGDGQPCIVMEYYDLGSLHDLRAIGLAAACPGPVPRCWTSTTSARA